MTVPVATTFRAHTTGDDHGKVFNFTGPRSRQWSKDRKSKRGLTALLPQGAEKAAAAQPAPAAVSVAPPPQNPNPQPVVATRPLPTPQTPKTVQPSAVPAAGQSAPKQVVAADLSEIGQKFWKLASSENRENWDPWTIMAEMGYSPEDMTESTGFGDATTYQRLMPIMERLKGNPQALAAFVRANQLNQDYVKEYLGRSGRPEDRSWWNNISMSPLRQTLAPENVQQGYQSALGKARNQALSELIAQGVPEAQATIRANIAAQQTVGSPEDFQRRLAARAYNDPEAVGGMGPGSLAQWLWLGGAPLALGAKATELGASDSLRSLWDPAAAERLQQGVEGRLESDALNKDFGYGVGDVLAGPLKGLFGGQGSIERGTAQTAAGLEKLRTLGTAQNRILLENLARRNRDTRAIEESEIGSAPTLQQSFGLEKDMEAAKRRRLEGAVHATPGDRRAWTEFQAATENPYRNLMTGDPWMGEMTAVQSAKSGRKWDPREWGSVMKDWLTDSDTSHEYLMKGQDTSFDEPGAGRFQPYQAATKLVQKGRYDPRSAPVGNVALSNPGQDYGVYDPRNWLMGWKQGQRTGAMSPQEAREQFDKQWGTKLDKGLLSAQDIQGFRKSFGGGQYGQDWLKATDFENRVNKNWAPNRPVGNAAMQYEEQPFYKLNAERWSKTAGWKDYEDKQTARTGYSLPQYYQYQAKLRQKMLLDILHGRMTGTGQTREDEDYGQGLWERWNKYGPGRFAYNTYAPFGKMFSQRDIRTLDPVLRAHREAILGGNWRSGMQIDPLVQRSGFGWTNPLGMLSERLGIIGSPEAQKRQLSEGVLKSPMYQGLRKDLASGKLSARDFYQRTRGVPVAEYDLGLMDAFNKGHVTRAGTNVRQIGELASEVDTSLDRDRSPYGVAAGF